MHFTLRQLRAFSAIGRLGSFTRAAEALCATQPALSAQINDLEGALGVRLFDRNRSTRSVTLTRAGADLLPVAEKILSDVGTLQAHAEGLQDLSLGRVAVGALPSVASGLMVRAIAGFRRAHPGISIVLRDELGGKVIQMIEANETDFGITVRPPSESHLTFIPLLKDELVALIPTALQVGRATRVTLAQLSELPLALMCHGSSVRQLVDEAFAASGLVVFPVYEPTFMSTAVAIVEAGLAVTLLPSSAVETQQSSAFFVRRVVGDNLTRELGILRKRERTLPPAAESFFDYLVEVAPKLAGAPHLLT